MHQEGTHGMISILPQPSDMVQHIWDAESSQMVSLTSERIEKVTQRGLLLLYIKQPAPATDVFLHRTHGW